MNKQLHKLTPATAVVAIACMAGAMGRAPRVEAASAGRDAPSVLLIQNVHVWDGASDQLMKGSHVGSRCTGP
jgi:hypothetical protein